MQDFRNLKVWQKNRAFTLDIYRATAPFPIDERFGLTSQMRRCVIRIGACIAEGTGRRTRKDTLHFFQTSFSSATELLHHLISALDLGYISQAVYGELDRKLEEIRKMLSALMKRLRGNDLEQPGAGFTRARSARPSTNPVDALRRPAENFCRGG